LCRSARSGCGAVVEQDFPGTIHRRHAASTPYCPSSVVNGPMPACSHSVATHRESDLPKRSEIGLSAEPLHRLTSMATTTRLTDYPAYEAALCGSLSSLPDRGYEVRVVRTSVVLNEVSLRAAHIARRCPLNHVVRRTSSFASIASDAKPRPLQPSDVTRSTRKGLPAPTLLTRDHRVLFFDYRYMVPAGSQRGSQWEKAASARPRHRITANCRSSFSFGQFFQFSCRSCACCSVLRAHRSSSCRTNIVAVSLHCHRACPRVGFPTLMGTGQR